MLCQSFERSEADSVSHCMLAIKMKDSTLHFTYTVNARETLDYMVKAAHTLADARFKNYKQEAGDEEKRQAMSNQDFFINILTNIDGVCMNMAIAIKVEYQSLGSLIKMYKSMAMEEGQILLKNLNYSENNAKIGVRTSERIYNVLYGNKDGNKKMNQL